jgi:hypothetical protein
MKFIYVDLYVMVYNRHKFLQECLDSIVNQEFDSKIIKLNIIVSHNFADEISGNSIIDIVKKFKTIKYVQRKNLSVENHHTEIIMESKGDYLVMFHDDDVMLNSYISKSINTLEKNKEFSAFACNANLIDEKSIFIKRLIKSKINEIIRSDIQLIYKYFSIKSFGVPPFSSYTIRRLMIELENENYNKVGVLSDVPFLLDLNKQGFLYWDSQSLINYRLHKNNSLVNIRGRIKLINYICSKYEISKRSILISDYKFLYLYKYFKKNFHKKIFFRRNFIIIVFLIKSYFRRADSYI